MAVGIIAVENSPSFVETPPAIAGSRYDGPDLYSLDVLGVVTRYQG